MSKNSNRHDVANLLEYPRVDVLECGESVILDGALLQLLIVVRLEVCEERADPVAQGGVEVAELHKRGEENRARLAVGYFQEKTVKEVRLRLGVRA